MSGAKEAMHSVTRGIIGAFEARVKGITAIKGEVATQRQAAQSQLKELDKAHQAMARRLRGELSKVRPALAQADRRQKAATGAFVKELAADHAGVRAEWQGLGRAMRALRNGGGAATPGAEGAEEMAAKAKGRRGNGGAKTSGQSRPVGTAGARA